MPEQVTDKLYNLKVHRDSFPKEKQLKDLIQMSHLAHLTSTV